jgi:IS30 family transposase
MLLMKKYKQLTSEQRYAIYLGLENGDTQRTIASLIGVSPSAVSRELQRNKDERGATRGDWPTRWRWREGNACPATGPPRNGSNKR